MTEIRKEMFVLIMLAELEDDTPVKPMGTASLNYFEITDIFSYSFYFGFQTLNAVRLGPSTCLGFVTNMTMLLN